MDPYDDTQQGDHRISMEREGDYTKTDGDMGVFRSIDNEIPPIA